MQPLGGTKLGRGVAGMLGLTFQALVGYHIHALISRVAALQALVPAPLTAEVRRGTGRTFEVAVSGNSSIWACLGRSRRVRPYGRSPRDPSC